MLSQNPSLDTCRTNTFRIVITVKSHPLNATLEKQDSSKSFDAVIKKVIMNERLKKIDSQDENKSQSMDERMFVDNNIRKASKIIDEVDTDALFKKISSTSEKTLHKDVSFFVRPFATHNLSTILLSWSVSTRGFIFI